MGTENLQLFGGDWTEQKLEALQKYLSAYIKILSKTPYRTAYIDAFAGTGYRENPDAQSTGPLFPELAGDEPQKYLDGSARIALRVDKPFDKYLLIEQNAKRRQELATLKEEFPDRADRIEIVDSESGVDCNKWLQERCSCSNWKNHRAVLFLDPYGMQVEWSTMEAIAKTEAIDVLILFPLGVAVNRLLRKDGNIEESWRTRLDNLFGTSDWYDSFYKEMDESNLFAQEQRVTKKVATLKSISDYYVTRLKSIFVEVADRPRALCNSRNNPLFHLCFAAGNPKGAKTAVKIAQHVLES